MKIKLSDHFTYGRLLRFTLPSVVMMVIASIYSVVDGLFVSNLVGDMALSAVNIIFPVAMIIGAFGFMLGTGGSAIVARTLGEGRRELAQRYFSMIIYAVILLGGVLTVVSVWLTEPIARRAGASDALIRDCVVYGRILLLGSVPFMLQVCFQSFFVVAERPQLGLAYSIAAGVTNMVLDYVLIAVFHLGIAGAAIATVLGYVVGGIIPLFYFATGERSGLRLTRSQLYPRQLLQACSNGSSELMSNISSSVISILYNLQLMRMVGELGVAAYSVMMYVDFVFESACLGFSIGSGAHCQLPLRRGQSERAEKRVPQEPVGRRGDLGCDGGGLGGFELSPVLCLCGIPPGAAGDDRAGLPPVCAGLSVLRYQYLCLLLLYRPVQRGGVGPALLPALSAAPGRDGAADAPAVWAGRDLVRGDRRRGAGGCGGGVRAGVAA